MVPSSGTTPAGVRIGLNPAVVAELQPGGYRLLVQFTTMDVSPPSTTGCSVLLMVPKPPPPGIQSVLNAVSRQPYPSPLAQVSITGSNLTGPTRSTKYDATGFYPTTDAGTSVLFNGMPAPLLHLSPGKIKAIVPFALAGQSSVEVVVRRFGQDSPAFTIPLQDTAPAVFTRPSSTGPGPILQGTCPPIAPATSCAGGQFTTNGPDNPAPPGTTLKIFATGTGVWGRPSESDIFLSGMSFPGQLAVTIGGLPAKILSAGISETSNTWSVLQVNAVLPDGLGSGPQPVVLTIGTNDNSQQQAMVWIQ